MNSTYTDKTTAASSNGSAESRNVSSRADDASQSASPSVGAFLPRKTCRGQRIPESRSEATQTPQETGGGSQAASRKTALSSVGGFVERVLDTHFTQLSMAVLGNKAGNEEDFDEFCSKVQSRKVEKNMRAPTTLAQSKR